MPRSDTILIPLMTAVTHLGFRSFRGKTALREAFFSDNWLNLMARSSVSKPILKYVVRLQTSPCTERGLCQGWN